ncbi:hypothetical protein [Roseimicrobium sp. ORNL1]|uniref:hypothetical protein n=1 Tax=Roseimicrobium sp. ORNL1 TaxID=2711231 RepID=UPI0013E1BC9B|nr:hypothetical protein [Roseimicrobium sp. ORNL1]QIF02863.1 hypothetical protein G5S37_15485 [Roseimicrobium sp. ORNL1]
MKAIPIICSLVALAVAALASAAEPAEPTGTWMWSTKSPDGEILTSLRLELKSGIIAGAYSNQHGDTAISDASLQGDLIRFAVVRDLGGKKYVVKYQGRIEGDTIKGTIQAPGHDGGEGVKLDWIAKRTTREKEEGAKPK